MPDVKTHICDQPNQLIPRLLSIRDFTPLGHIGKGAHGRVLLVYDKKSRQEYALKIVEKDTLHLTSYPRIFEEQLVGRKLLDCPWALGIEGSFQDHDYFYFLTVSNSEGWREHELTKSSLTEIPCRRRPDEISTDVWQAAVLCCTTVRCRIGKIFRDKT